MAHDSLLAHVPIPARQVFPMRCAGDAGEAARRYEALLRLRLGPTPRFALVLLGLGPDGHTASLFPGRTCLDEASRWVVAVRRRQEKFWRLTLTSGLINQAARVLFLVSGAAKAEALRRALAGDPRVPASRVRPESGELVWLVDAAAAARLGKRAREMASEGPVPT